MILYAVSGLAKEAVALMPNSSDYRWTQAVAELRNEQFEAAIATAKTARELDPQESLRSNIVEAYGELMLGNRRQARDVYQRIVASLHHGKTLKRVERPIFQEIAPRCLFDAVRLPQSTGTIVVNTLQDEVDGTKNGKISLREAVWMAGPGDRIEFAVNGDIHLSHGPIEINQSLEIAGPDAQQLTIHASPDARIFTVRDDDMESQFRFALSGIRLTGGSEIWPSVKANVPIGNTTKRSSAADGLLRGTAIDPKFDFRGGAIYSTENLRIQDVAFESNVATNGGALYAEKGAKLNLHQCVFRNNGAENFLTIQGGACYLGGSDTTDLRVTNCEFSNNVAQYGGATTMSCNASFENCTFSGNRSGQASCIHIWQHALEIDFTHCTFAWNYCKNILTEKGQDFAAPIRFTNSIAWNNSNERGAAPLISDSSDRKVIAQNCVLDMKDDLEDKGNNLFDVDPLLGPLADNGGLVRTHALLEGSPAIDAGASGIQQTPSRLSASDLPEFDGRGQPFARNVDGDGIEGAKPDIGAFEFQP